MFTIADVYLEGILAFCVGVIVASVYFVTRKPKRDSRGRFVK